MATTLDVTRNSYTLKEVGEMTGRFPSSLRRSIKDGKVKAHKVGRDWHISYQEVKRLLETNQK